MTQSRRPCVCVCVWLCVPCTRWTHKCSFLLGNFQTW